MAKKKNFSQIDNMFKLEEHASSVMSQYLKEVAKKPTLPHPELVNLFKQFESGDTCAKKKIIEANLRLVISIAKPYFRSAGVPFEEIIQEGNLGLIKGVEMFKWNKGFKFSTYATWWIKQSIGQYLLKKKRIIRLPAHAANIQKKMMQATDKFKIDNGYMPSTDDLIDIMDSSETVIKATSHATHAILSLSQPHYGKNVGGSASEEQLGATIVDEKQDIFDTFSNIEMIKIAKKVLQELSPKESAIIRLRFGLYEDPTNGNAYPITKLELDSVMDGKGLQ